MSESPRTLDTLKDTGLLGLGSRLKRLSDRLMASGVEIYAKSGLDFEPRWFPVYSALVKLGPTPVGELAEAIGWSHAAVSQTAKKMTQAKVVTSKKDPKDERRRVLDLSDTGRALLPSLQAVWDDIESSIRDAAEHGGFDILAAIEGVEDALNRQSLLDRYLDHAKARVRATVRLDLYRAGNEEDRASFGRLNRQWLEADFTVEPADEALFARPEKVLEGGGVIFLARIGDDPTVVGTAAMIRDEDGAFELSKMAVDPAYRGRQIGRALMNGALDWAREKGLDGVYLLTSSKLGPALGLYRATGFTVTHAGPHPKYARSDLRMDLAF